MSGADETPADAGTEAGTDAGDAAERATRAGFGRAMEHALPLLDDRVEAPDAAGARPTPVEQALQAGWLVAVAPPAGAPRSGPLRGLTVAVKDIVDVAGLPVRNGTPGFWRDPDVSAAAWRLLQDAGAHCVGKAATHEMAWGVTTPAIAHPADPERVAGGSSGGSAACVAAGVAAGGLGTDTGGSIRIPAALCGVVGLRPTHGTTDLTGITPLAPSQDVAGPLARDVRTCAAMAEVLLGRPLPLDDRGQRGRDLDGVRLGVLADPGLLDAPTATAYDAALARLRDNGAEIVPVQTSLVRDTGAVSLLTMLHESATLHAHAVDEEPDRFGGEARALLTLGRPLQVRASALQRARTRLTGDTWQLFARHRLDAVLTPTTQCVAPPRGAATVPIGGRDVPVSSALAKFTGWAAVTGFPAVSVPAPAPGLPVGLQVMARPWREELCLRVAKAVEGPAVR